MLILLWSQKPSEEKSSYIGSVDHKDAAILLFLSTIFFNDFINNFYQQTHEGYKQQIVLTIIVIVEKEVLTLLTQANQQVLRFPRMRQSRDTKETIFLVAEVSNPCGFKIFYKDSILYKVCREKPTLLSEKVSTAGNLAK